jgi:RNA polymerase sigma-70 factor (ECF subfamily)
VRPHNESSSGPSDRATALTPGPEPELASDGSLLRRCHQGDDDAAAALYGRYADRLIGLVKGQCARDLARRFDAEDIVQSVFRAFFHRARQGFYAVAPGEELWGLLLVMALNKMRSRAAFHRSPRRDVRLTLGGEGLEREPDPDREEAVTVLRMVVEETLAGLPAPCEAIVKLRMDGHEIAAIADQTGRSKRTVERVLQEFRKRLTESPGS